MEITDENKNEIKEIKLEIEVIGEQKYQRRKGK